MLCQLLSDSITDHGYFFKNRNETFKSYSFRSYVKVDHTLRAHNSALFSFLKKFCTVNCFLFVFIDRILLKKTSLFKDNFYFRCT